MSFGDDMPDEETVRAVGQTSNRVEERDTPTHIGGNHQPSLTFVVDMSPRCMLHGSAVRTTRWRMTTTWARLHILAFGQPRGVQHSPETPESKTLGWVHVKTLVRFSCPVSAMMITSPPHLLRDCACRIQI